LYNQIQFQIEGPGRFIGPDKIAANTGMAQIIFTADSTSGIANIIASSPGLISDTLSIEVANRFCIDDFEDYESKSDLEYKWFVRPGTSAAMLMTNSITGEPGTGLIINYALGDGNAPYAGVFRRIDEDLSMSQYLEFWLKGDASERNLAILIFEKNGRYWQYNYILSNDEPEFIRIPINDFIASDSEFAIKLDDIDEISFNILKGAGEFGQGSVILDDINIAIQATETSLQYAADEENLPSRSQLMQNYPNPFNPVTTIKYIIHDTGPVKIEIYNILGEKVQTLVNEIQQPGNYKLTFDSSDYTTGIYTYTLKTGSYMETRKMLYIK